MKWTPKHCDRQGIRGRFPAQWSTPVLSANMHEVDYNGLNGLIDAVVMRVPLVNISACTDEWNGSVRIYASINVSSNLELNSSPSIAIFASSVLQWLLLSALIRGRLSWAIFMKLVRFHLEAYCRFLSLFLFSSLLLPLVSQCEFIPRTILQFLLRWTGGPASLVRTRRCQDENAH